MREAVKQLHRKIVCLEGRKGEEQRRAEQSEKIRNDEGRKEEIRIKS